MAHRRTHTEGHLRHHCGIDYNPHTHARTSGHCIDEQGVDVLVEKPLAMNEAEAQTTVETAKSYGRLLCVGHLFRYHVAIRKAAEMIANGEIGPVLHIESERFQSANPAQISALLPHSRFMTWTFVEI